MRPLRRRSNPVDGEPNPVSALGVNDEHLAVEIQQYLGARMLSTAAHGSKVILY